MGVRCNMKAVGVSDKLQESELHTLQNKALNIKIYLHFNISCSVKMKELDDFNSEQSRKENDCIADFSMDFAFFVYEVIELFVSLIYWLIF